MPPCAISLPVYTAVGIDFFYIYELGKGGDEVKIGDIVWVPCEVKLGPFPNERLVRIQSGHGEWVGFVEEQAIEGKKKKGVARVLARIAKIVGGDVVVTVQAHTFDTNYIRESSHKVSKFVPIKA